MARKPSGLESLSLPAKLAIGLVFVLLAAVAYFILFYSDIDAQIATQYETREAKKRELADAQEAKNAYNRDIAEKTRREQLARKQKKILPDDAEAPAFLSTLQTVATIAGIKLGSWKPEDQKIEQFFAKVPMELKVQGKFHQIVKFFHQVGQVDRIINIENIVMTTKAAAAAAKPGANAEETINVDVTCLATAFRAVRGDEGSKKRGAK